MKEWVYILGMVIGVLYAVRRIYIHARQSSANPRSVAESKNEKKRSYSQQRVFDIATPTTLIVCTTRIWDAKNIASTKAQLGKQKQIADAVGKKFEMYSQQPIPEVLKQWLNKKHIIFKEG